MAMEVKMCPVTIVEGAGLDQSELLVELSELLKYEYGKIVDWNEISQNLNRLFGSSLHHADTADLDERELNPEDVELLRGLKAIERVAIGVSEKFTPQFLTKLEKAGRIKISPDILGELIGVIVCRSFDQSRTQRLKNSERSARLARLAEELTRALDEEIEYNGRDHHLLNTMHSCRYLNSIYARRDDSKPPSDQEQRARTIVWLLKGISHIYSKAGGKITLGGGAFSKFLEIIWEALPKTIRPISAGALIKRARKNLKALQNEHERLSY
jgi:hypothetical protein